MAVNPKKAKPLTSTGNADSGQPMMWPREVDEKPKRTKKAKPTIRAEDVKHPMQPLCLDEHGTLRFKRNAIVLALLEHGRQHGFNMNTIAMMPFNREDREQFAQLIGYSHSGFGELSYCTDTVYDASQLQYALGIPELEARNVVLETRFKNLKDALREPIADLYGKHPSDL